MYKKEARQQYREKRAALSPAERSKLDDLLLIHFQQLPLPYLTTVLSFWPIENWNEVNSFLFTDFLLFRYPGLQVAYPVTNVKEARMDAVIATDETRFQKKGNIHEPEAGSSLTPAAIDLIIVPLLAFDEKGHRVGYGKGCYDRYFTNCREDCLRVGLSYFPPVAEFSDTGQFDVPLSFCITPQQIYAF